MVDTGLKSILESSSLSSPTIIRDCFRVFENQILTSKKKAIPRKKISVDHFIVEKKQIYAGKHLLLDLWGIKFDNSITTLKKIIKNATKVSKATMLHIHLHRFGKEQGISGVAVLAESHISVHTWPERD